MTQYELLGIEMGLDENRLVAGIVTKGSGYFGGNDATFPYPIYSQLCALNA